MKNKTIFILCLILGASAFSGTFTGYVSGSHELRRRNIELSEAAKAEKTRISKNGESVLTTKYMLKEKDGNIGLYRVIGENTELYDVYAADVSSLPENDREELKKGITDLTLDEALLLIDDFTG